MPINGFSKTIFIHVPKSAGMTILQLSCLKHHCPGSPIFGAGHTTLSDIRNKMPRKYKHYFVMSVVRNPYERIASAFFYLKNGGMQNKFDLHFQRLLKPYEKTETGFFHFVFDIKKHRFHNKIIHFRPMHHFLCDHKTGKLLTNNIFRLEDELPKLKTYLLQKKIISFDHEFDNIVKKKKKNETPSYPKIDWFGSSSKDILRGKKEIQSIYAKDFMLFYVDMK